MGEFSKIKVHCSQCDGENIVKFDELRNLKFIRCSSCGNFFNLFGLYRSLYDKIELCKVMVDIFAQNLYSDYFIEPKNSKDDVGIINKILLNNSFNELLKQIIFDIVLYGNSFIHVNKNYKLTRIDLSKIEFIIDFVNRKPFKSFSYEIVKLKELKKLFKSYDTKEVLHFIGEPSIDGRPLGESICGFYFDSWYLLREVPEPILIMKSQNVDVSKIEWFRDFEESNIIGASGIPHKDIFPWYQITAVIDQMEKNRFKNIIRRRRNNISRVMEREFFPKILNRKFESDSFPRFKFIS